MGVDFPRGFGFGRMPQPGVGKVSDGSVVQEYGPTVLLTFGTYNAHFTFNDDELTSVILGSSDHRSLFELPANPHNAVLSTIELQSNQEAKFAFIGDKGMMAELRLHLDTDIFEGTGLTMSMSRQDLIQSLNALGWNNTAGVLMNRLNHEVTPERVGRLAFQLLSVAMMSS